MTPFLLTHELDELTFPLIQAAARKRFLRSIGISFTTRPDGHPLVSREAVADRLLHGRTPGADTPNAAAMRARFQGSRNGKTAKKS